MKKLIALTFMSLSLFTSQNGSALTLENQCVYTSTDQAKNFKTEHYLTIFESSGHKNERYLFETFEAAMEAQTACLHILSSLQCISNSRQPAQTSFTPIMTVSEVSEINPYLVTRPEASNQFRAFISLTKTSVKEMMNRSYLILKNKQLIDMSGTAENCEVAKAFIARQGVHEIWLKHSAK